MHKSFGLIVGAMVALAALGGCDDQDSVAQAAHATSKAAASARVGPGWHLTSERRSAGWGFAAGAGDSLEAIRAALAANMLPPKDSVRIAPLVDRFAAVPADAAPAGQAPRTAVKLTTTPWNDDTLLLWVSVAGDEAAGVVLPRDLVDTPDRSAIQMEFDSKQVAAFRPMGDPQGLPPRAQAAALYELAPVEDFDPKPATRLATLRIRYRAPDGAVKELERPITGADLVEAVQDAPETMRFAVAVAGFAGLLRGDPALRDLSADEVVSLAESAAEPDPDGVRAELIGLMRKAEPLIDLPPGDSATSEEPGQK